MNVHRAVTGSRVEGVSNDKVHLVNIDTATDDLVKIRPLIVPQTPYREQSDSMRVESCPVKLVSDLRLVDNPWHKVLVSLLEMPDH